MYKKIYREYCATVKNPDSFAAIWASYECHISCNGLRDTPEEFRAYLFGE